jgi:hypothetical protein
VGPSSWGEPDAWAELVALMDATGWSKALVCDAVARELALGFDDGALSYDVCDDLVNEMIGWIEENLASDPESFLGHPDFFMRVYGAFDAGEFVHEGDSREVDPVEKFTRPSIAAIVRDIRET